MKIGLVTPFDLAAGGGVNEHVRHLYQSMGELGHSVRIIAPSSAPQTNPDIHTVGRITPVQINGSVARVSLSLTLAPKLRDVLRRERFDVLHIHEPLSPTLPTTLLRVSETVNVGTFHAAGKRSLGYATIHRYLSRLAPRLHGRIAVSEASMQFAGRYFPGEYTIIPNGVDTERYLQPVDPLPEYQDGNPTVLFVGRYSDERKGFRYLLEAMALVQERLPQVRLLVVGSGDPSLFRSYLRPLQQVEFLGFVDDAKLSRLYRSADLFCAPSIGQESFGIVLLEAMAAGCPIVAADNPGYRQVLEHRRQGLLVQPRNVEALAVAILQVLQDQSLRQALAAQGVQKAQSYSWNRITKDILAFYERVIHTTAALVEVADD